MLMSAAVSSDVDAPAETSIAGAAPVTSTDSATAGSTRSVDPGRFVERRHVHRPRDAAVRQDDHEHERRRDGQRPLESAVWSGPRGATLADDGDVGVRNRGAAASVDDRPAERQCRCGNRQSEKEKGADASQHAAKSNSESSAVFCYSASHFRRNNLINDDKAPEPRLLARRELLQIGAASLAALGAASATPAGEGLQTPGSGQGARPPEPPAPETIANPATMRVEDWSEPWVWRPEEWPGQPLTLQIVGNRHLPRAVSPGNRFAPLYSFNGASPGPTIRTRGDATLRVKVRNMLGPNHGQVPKGPTPDPFEIPPADLEAALCAISKAQGTECTTPPTRVLEHLDEILHYIPATLVDTSCLSSPANVPHGSHTTNLHTHGVHVQPGTNPNGTQGDNTFLRILPKGDWEIRQRAGAGMPPHARTA